MHIELVVFDLDVAADLDAGAPREVFGMTPALRRLRARRVVPEIVAKVERMAAQVFAWDR